MIYDDDPIELFSEYFPEDELGRHKFAISVANSILAYKSKKSLVVGITGEWGSGKTTLINMILKQIDPNVIKTEDEGRLKRFFNKIFRTVFPNDVKEGIILFKFNPWYFSEKDQLLSYFFLELNNQLNKIEGFKDITKKLKSYSSHLLTVLGIVVFPKQTQATVGYLDKIGHFDKTEDIQSLKNDLFDSLKKKSVKILITIDDIDRLDKKEIKEIFKLIRLIGNFPNTIYLVSFDRKVVEKALEEEGISGEEYLKKIIPVMFEVPNIDKSELKDQFFEKITEIKDLTGEEESILSNLYDSGLIHFFNNLRDLKRFVNTLYFTYIPVKDDVYFADFVAITALQMFQPDLYKQIKNNKKLFTSWKSDFRDRDEIIRNINEIVYDLNDNLSPDLKKNILEYLKNIFPKLRLIYNNYDARSDAPEWAQEKRVCHESYFHRYFKFSVPEWDFSDAEMSEFLGMPNEQDFVKYLENNEKSGIILSELHWFVEKNKMNDETIDIVIGSLLRYGDLILEDPFTFGASEKIKILRILIALYNKIGYESFLKIFKTKIASDTIYTACGFSDSLIKDRKSLDPKLTSDQKDTLLKFMCSKIYDIFRFSLRNLKNPLNILYFYQINCKSAGSILSILDVDNFIILFSDIISNELSVEENLDRIKRNNLIDDMIDDIKNKLNDIKSSSDFDDLKKDHKDFLVLFEKILEKYDGPIIFDDEI
ncbi:KAP family P-loop NTPase fold protein [Methanobacterium congolense]|uniref:Phage T7 exclusion protein n=1 Tax=Methanobacterium congolense TaxID=118062 RepID=A0A1D3L159_9EURY|nr:P-loop NTPase fold protein [Methanobacterium congolense]SCG85308.1 Phage T7 exclusion protein [Methanobacterium congolense]